MHTRPQGTRRDFLVVLARSAVFTPALVATVRVAAASAQGGGSSSGGKSSTTSSVVGSLSPTSQAITTPTFQFQQESAQKPWSPGQPGQPAPWSRPPPTQTGR